MSKPEMRYGNWMGAGHPDDLEGMVSRGDSLPLPWNAIDDACKSHDFKYIQGDTDVWGNAEADRQLSTALYRIADARNMWRYKPEPPVGENEGNASNYSRTDNSPLTDAEFFLALGVAMEMEYQSNITLISSVIDGHLGAFFKHIAMPKTILAPLPFTETVIKYAAGKLGIDRDTFVGQVIDGALAGFEILLHQQDIIDIYNQYVGGAIDAIGDVAEGILDAAPEVLKEAVKGTGDDARLILTHPKKGLKNEGEKLLLVGGKALYFTKHPKKAIELLRKDGSGISLIAPGADLTLRAGAEAAKKVVDTVEDIKELIEHPKKKLKKMGGEAKDIVDDVGDVLEKLNPFKW